MTNPFYDSKKLIVSRTGEQAYKDYLARMKNEKNSGSRKQKQTQTTTPLNVPSNINKSDYIVMPNAPNRIISNYELFKQDRLNWENSCYKLAENGLWMPNTALFMPYFLKVKEASEGKTTLQYADGNNVPLDKARDLWKYLTTNFNSGVWTWLDDKFIKTQNQLYHETEHRVVDNNGNKILKANKISPLEQCIMEDCYVDLSFNKQGLATTKSSKQEYKQGENIYFWYPREDCVARFGASSVRAGLGCDGDPSYSDGALGVFACAEGIPKK